MSTDIETDEQIDGRPFASTQDGYGIDARCLHRLGETDIGADRPIIGSNAEGVGQLRLPENAGPKHQPFDHHAGRSTAATYFDPSDVDDTRKRHRYERLSNLNDGTRDRDRQSVEGELDKFVWIDTYGHRLSLPRWVIGEAKRLLADLGDIRRLGNYNDLYVAVLGTLTLAYQRHWIYEGYRQSPTPWQKRWCDRADFKRLWTDLDLTEDDLRRVASLIDRKTEV